MKIFLRLFLMLLLGLALPLNGMASALASVQPCLQQHGQTHAMHGSMNADLQMAAGTHDCCDHQKGSQKVQKEMVKLCKHGHECKSSNPLQVSVIRSPLLPPARFGAPSFSFAAPLPAFDSFWRPPRA
ncbi:hypothetical protein [Azomonas macrocytogenes]|uniref:Uncharacterized protein n=1 Tax=Azomonas macrocytogenes TaxID=69962 RepID=A0A839T1C3_AZOMA|nr:hypothetical protein [Azomonas macrocytogenes]MBB3103341.1 hypothetical protein [Azomonas macrocytogenes]